MRVVLVRLSALGDIVHTWPLATALGDDRPDLHLTWIVEEPLRALVEGHPAVDSVIPAATQRWRRRPLAARTRAEIATFKGRLLELQPDVCLDPQGVAKSALVTRWSRAPRRVGLAAPWRRERLARLAYTETVPGSSSQSHVVATNLELVRALGGTPDSEVPCPDGSWLLDRQRGHRPPGREGGKPLAVILPGAGRPDKVLPVNCLAAVARGLAASGLKVVLVWGPGEQERARDIVELAGAGSELAPPTDIGEMAVLLGRARIVVGGDTGPVHLAASFGTPVVATFLSTDWRRNGPLGRHVQVISAAVPRDRGPTGSARARQARAVTVDEILAATNRLLGC